MRLRGDEQVSSIALVAEADEAAAGAADVGMPEGDATPEPEPATAENGNLQ
jgi:hypothetical protein